MKSSITLPTSTPPILSLPCLFWSWSLLVMGSAIFSEPCWIFCAWNGSVLRLIGGFACCCMVLFTIDVLIDQRAPITEHLPFTLMMGLIGCLSLCSSLLYLFLPLFCSPNLQRTF